MNSYSQNAEDVIVAQLFERYVGTLLEIGANDGMTFSNSKLLIEKGWKAHLVEPSSTFAQLERIHADNPNVTCYNFGIGAEDTTVRFYESGPHVPGGTDYGLVSTFDYKELKRWPDVKFITKNLPVVSWKTFTKNVKKFDFISIDVEGLEWDILQQIDLKYCKVLCIEYNGNTALLWKFMDYCKGFRLVDKNNENLIFSRI